MKKVILIIAFIAMVAQANSEVCESYKDFISIQSKNVLTIKDEYKKQRATRTLLNVIENSFDSCYGSLPDQERNWFREQYIFIWKINESFNTNQ